MATFKDVGDEIIAETGLDDLTTIIYPYLYDTVKSICELRTDWPFLEMNAQFSPAADVGTYLLSSVTNFPNPVNNIKQFKILQTDNYWFFPDWVDFPEFEELHLNDYGGNAITVKGKPTIYSIGPVESAILGNRALYFRPYTDVVYTMSLTYWMDHPTGISTTVYVPNTELIKAGVKMRIYGDRGDQAAMQNQAVIFKLALGNLYSRYGGVETRGRNRIKRYF